MVQVNHPTTEWTSLQDIFYRRTELYALSWGIDNLADYVVAASSNGGLVALIRDPTRLVSLGKASLLKPKILVYTAAGQLVESIPWDASLRIIALDFNALEQLVVVLEEGNVRLYTLLSPCPVSADPASSTSTSRNRPAPIEATSNSYYTSIRSAQKLQRRGSSMLVSGPVGSSYRRCKTLCGMALSRTRCGCRSRRVCRRDQPQRRGRLWLCAALLRR